MKFEFAFQKLLDHKRSLEDIARREWLEAKAVYDKAAAELAEMYQQIDLARERVGEIGSRGGARGPERRPAAGPLVPGRGGRDRRPCLAGAPFRQPVEFLRIAGARPGRNRTLRRDVLHRRAAHA